jgi:hypothetical protein
MRNFITLGLLLTAAALVRAQPGDRPAREGEVRIAKLVYAGGKTTVCFADGFLATVERQTKIKVDRRFASVELASEELFNFPFVIFSGEGAFKLSDKEKANLKAYLNRGGFVLASAGCSSAPWAASFESVMREILPDDPMRRIDLKHAVFHTLFDIDRLVAKKASEEPAIYALQRQDRAIVIYSSTGLNDTGNAGGGCCCCGGNELQNAHLINANVLAYVLTR